MSLMLLFHSFSLFSLILILGHVGRCHTNISLPFNMRCTFLRRQLADVHGLVEHFNGQRECRGQRHLALLVVLLQHGHGCL